MKEHTFEKEYQLWLDFGYEGWGFDQFDTLEECISADKHDFDWLVTRRVDFEVVAVKK